MSLDRFRCLVRFPRGMPHSAKLDFNHSLSLAAAWHSQSGTGGGPFKGYEKIPEGIDASGVQPH